MKSGCTVLWIYVSESKRIEREREIKLEDESEREQEKKEGREEGKEPPPVFP